MHRFFRSAGFPDLMTEKDIYEFIEREAVKEENLYQEVNIDSSSSIREYRLMLSGSIGLCAGFLIMNGHLPVLSYYFPFYETFEETSVSEVILERHIEKEVYSGIIDDLAPGISLIFFMTNSLDFVRKIRNGTDPLRGFNGSYLAAFADEGKVLLPIARDEEPMVLYEEIKDRAQNEDLYSVVDQTFIPWGVECDQYSIVGEIKSVDTAYNIYTGIPLWLLSVSCNGVDFRLCMRKDDLLGEPAPGRRIKCGIWLHGHINLES